MEVWFSHQSKSPSVSSNSPGFCSISEQLNLQEAKKVVFQSTKRLPCVRHDLFISPSKLLLNRYGLHVRDEKLHLCEFMETFQICRAMKWQSGDWARLWLHSSGSLQTESTSRQRCLQTQPPSTEKLESHPLPHNSLAVKLEKRKNSVNEM